MKNQTPPQIPPVKSNEWQLYGRCIDGQYPKVCDNPITIPEQTSNLAVRRYTPPNPISQESIVPAESFGVPVEAGLAVKLINNAYTKTSELFDTYLHSFVDEKEKEAAEKTIINLQNIAYGVAFNKTIILKILSQPNCEGIRSYLCARETPDGLHYSLIMVGIDSNGYDLNYPPVTFPASVHLPENQKKTLMIDGNIPTQSLVGEYGNPPGGGGILGFRDKVQVDEHYYLLKQAVGVEK